MIISTTPTIYWEHNTIHCNGNTILNSSATSSLDICSELYRSLKMQYPKFFKMDILSKVAIILTEILLQENRNFTFEEILDQTAVVIATTEGCISVDKQFNDTIQNIPSPALFVYTLPNIMLGEICIKHGFKGEQMCFIQEQANPDFLNIYANDLLIKRGSKAVITGYINATDTKIAAQLWLLYK